eukprot:374612_1
MMLFCNTLLLLFATTKSSSIGVTVFEPWEGGYPCIRIPSITATSDGTLVAFAECRAWIGDGCHPNNNTTTITSKISANQNDRWICQKTSNDNGSTWSNLSFPFGLSFTTQNPTCVYDYINNKLILQADAHNGQKNHSIYQIYSKDNGKTWYNLVDIGYKYLSSLNPTYLFTGLPTGLQLLNNASSKYYGRILFSGHFNTSYGAIGHVWYSDDYGETYKISNTSLSHMQEESLVELSNGSIVDNMRNANIWNCNCRGIAISNDYGESFSDAYPQPQLISPGCEGSVISIRNGSMIFFSNPSSIKSRVNMTVKKSINNGNTWDKSYSLCESCGGAYSCLTSLPQFDGNKIGLLWETNSSHCQGPSCQTVFSLIPVDF